MSNNHRTPTGDLVSIKSSGSLMKTGTVRGFRRLFVRYAAITLLTTTVLSVGIAGTASAASATLTPVGTFNTTGSTGLTTASATLVNPGDVLAIWVQAQNQTTAGHVTGISASGTGAIGTAVKAISYTTVQHANNDDEIWYAPVMTAGAVTVTFAWSGTPAGVSIEYSTQEFQPSSTATYTTDTSNSLEVSVSSATVNFPSLTSAGANELYLGYNSNSTNGVYGAPTTSGYTHESGATGDAIIFNANTSGTQAPLTTATSTGSVQSAIGAMIIATAATGNTVTFNANGGTGTMTNETATTSTALTPNSYTFTGHTFTGWNTVALGGGTPYADGAPYPFTSSTTLYAQWSTPSAIALVSGSTSSTKVGTTGAITVTSALNVASSANVLLAMVQVFGPNSTGMGSISDTKTGTWTALGQTTASGDTQFVIWQCTNPQAGVKHAITWTPSAADKWGSLVVMSEWTGGPFTLDKTSSVLAAKGTSGATPSVTPSTTGELVLASAADEIGTSAWTNPTKGFTALATPDSANVMAYLLDSTASAINTAWSVSPSDSGVTAIFALY